MTLSARLSEATHTLSDDDLRGVLSEDVLHDMMVGQFSVETVQEAFASIFASYGLTEEDESLVEEAVDEFGRSMDLEEGFLDWLKGAAKKALKAVGTAALGAAKEGGKKAIASTAAELKKKLGDDEPKAKDEPEPEEKPKKPRKKRVPRKKAAQEPEKAQEPEGEPEVKGEPKGEPKGDEPPEEKPRKKQASRKKAAQGPKAEPEPKPEPKDDEDEDEDEDEPDIKKRLKGIARKGLAQIADDPGRVKDVLKKQGKKAIKALAKHGVKKGMKMVFGRWLNTGDKDSKKEEAERNSAFRAFDWLLRESDVSVLADGTVVRDFEGEVPQWVAEAIDFEGVTRGYRGEYRGYQYMCIPGDMVQFAATERRSILERQDKEE